MVRFTAAFAAKRAFGSFGSDQGGHIYVFITRKTRGNKSEIFSQLKTSVRVAMYSFVLSSAGRLEHRGGGQGGRETRSPFLVAWRLQVQPSKVRSELGRFPPLEEFSAKWLIVQNYSLMQD
jgi:hypothetical protein